MIAPLVRTSVCTKPGKSFAAISFGGSGGSSGKDTGFAATVCVACPSLGLVTVPIRAAANESLSMSRRFIVRAEFELSRVGNGAQVVVAVVVLSFTVIVLIRLSAFFTSASISRLDYCQAAVLLWFSLLVKHYSCALSSKYRL